MAETRIREALELLRERGWCQGSFETEDGQLCIEGAIDVALDLGDEHGWAFATATGSLDCEALDAVVHDYFSANADFITFNDHPDTTFADVELVMTKAAIMREEAGRVTLPPVVSDLEVCPP